MKSIKAALPDFYIVYAKDTAGDIWSFVNHLSTAPNVKCVGTIEDLPRYDKVDALTLVRKLKENPRIWSESLEDADDESTKLLLVRTSLRMCKIVHQTYLTMAV